jgi:hypothetical protein
MIVFVFIGVDFFIMTKKSLIKLFSDSDPPIEKLCMSNL